MNKPCLPWTREQSIVAGAIRETYGETKVVKNPTEEDPALTIDAEFWGDSYSGYELEISINPDGTLREQK